MSSASSAYFFSFYDLVVFAPWLLLRLRYPLSLNVIGYVRTEMASVKAFPAEFAPIRSECVELVAPKPAIVAHDLVAMLSLLRVGIF
jgi:hypothetical protein